MPLSLLTYHLIDDLVMSQEKLINTAKLQNSQLQEDRHPGIQTCTGEQRAQSTAVESSFTYCKIKFTPLAPYSNGGNNILNKNYREQRYP